MSLTDEEKKVLIQLQIEKADTFLNQARFLYDNKMWDMAANRFYYAMFHLTYALFIENGINSRTHTGMINLFHLHFVKEGKVSPELGSFLSRMEQMREQADYNCSYGIDEKEITDIIPYVEQFFKEVKALLYK